jgi:hypothetical protein
MGGKKRRGRMVIPPHFLGKDVAGRLRIAYSVGDERAEEDVIGVVVITRIDLPS